MPAHSGLLEYQTFEASAARTVSANGTAFDTGDWDILTAQVRVTAAGGTTPTLVVRIQTTYDDGATWTDIAVVDTEITGSSRKIISTSVPGNMTTTGLGSFSASDGTLAFNAIPKPIALGTQCRFQWTLGGVSPSFTFAITGVLRRLA